MQGAFYAKGFVTPITNAAWWHKPEFGIIATKDKSIDPEIQRNMYKCSNTKVIEVPGSHAVYMAHAKEVANMIALAAQTVG